VEFFHYDMWNRNPKRAVPSVYCSGRLEAVIESSYDVVIEPGHANASL
jgi:hypothetical protein